MHSDSVLVRVADRNDLERLWEVIESLVDSRMLRSDNGITYEMHLAWIQHCLHQDCFVVGLLGVDLIGLMWFRQKSGSEYHAQTMIVPESLNQGTADVFVRSAVECFYAEHSDSIRITTNIDRINDFCGESYYKAGFTLVTESTESCTFEYLVE